MPFSGPLSSAKLNDFSFYSMNLGKNTTQIHHATTITQKNHYLLNLLYLQKLKMVNAHDMDKNKIVYI